MNLNKFLAVIGICASMIGLTQAKFLIFSNERAQTQSDGKFVLDVQDYEDEIELKFGNNVDAAIVFDRVADKFVINRDIEIQGNLNVSGSFLDADGDAGISGQILASTNVGTDWVNNDSLPTTCVGGELLKWNDTNTIWECANDAGSLVPFVGNMDVENVATVSLATFTVTGNNFTPTSVVTIPGFPGTIDTMNVISSTEIEITVTTTAVEAMYDILVSNNGVLNTQWAGNGQNLLNVSDSSWIDLRLGGAAFSHGNGAGNDIRYRSGMSMARDANGMSFAGSNPWSSWVKFESLGWTRGQNKTLEWIFTNPTAAMMLGIGSTATNETNTTQYQQAEVEAYFSGSTNLWGLYGNNGTLNSAGNQSNGTTFSGTGTYKIKFTNDGAVGGVFTMYELPSASLSDWDNESVVLKTFTIGGSLNPNKPNIMPFIIPRADTQRFIAVRVE